MLSYKDFKRASLNESKQQNDLMYRNEEYGGSGVSDIEDVICYEVGELRNEDIFDYCIDNYKLSDTLLRKIEDVRAFIDDDGFNEDDKDLRDTVKQLVAEVSKICGKTIRYGLWLATKEAVLDIYDGEEDSLSAYKPTDVVFSDLGYDGVLFGYEEKPEEE